MKHKINIEISLEILLESITYAYNKLSGNDNI